MSFGIEVQPDLLQKNSKNQWILNSDMARSGGGLFAVVAEWCGHCTHLKTAIREAQKINAFSFFYLDGGNVSKSHRAKLEEMQIDGFPTVFYVGRDGVLTLYNGKRSPEALAQVFHR